MIKEQKGQSLVEFALVLPLLLLLICGIVDLGRLLYAYSSLNMTAQESVRLGGLGETDADIITYAINHVSIGKLDPSGVKIEPNENESTRKPGNNVKVTLSYSLPFITPIMSKIIPAPVLSANSTIRIE